MRKYIFLFLLVCNFLTGCASIPRYISNPNCPQASLGVLNFNIFTNEIIIGEIYLDPYACKNPRILYGSVTGQSRLINANQLITFSVTYTPLSPVIATGSPMCFVTPTYAVYTSFVPKPGHTYFITGASQNCTDGQPSLIISDRLTVCQNGHCSYVYNKVASIRRDCRPISFTDIQCYDIDYVKKNMRHLFED